MTQKGQQRVRKGSEKFESTTKRSKMSNEFPQKCLKNEPFYCKMNHCEMWKIFIFKTVKLTFLARSKWSKWPSKSH